MSAMKLRGWVDAIKQPEFTGENRCYPCTIVNVGLSVLLAGLVGVLFVPAGIVVFVSLLSLIYLRGYVVPGTPELTARYLPASVLRFFDKYPDAGPEVGADGGVSVRSEQSNEPKDEVDIGMRLKDSGIVEECADQDDLCLTETFKGIWWRRIKQVRDDEVALSRLAMILELDPADLELRRDDNGYTVVMDDARLGSWISAGAFYADLAAESTLAEFVDGWDDISGRDRTQMIAALRVFLERCPNCDGTLENVENVRKSCCSSDIVSVSVSCNDCGDTIFQGNVR